MHIRHFFQTLPLATLALVLGAAACSKPAESKPEHPSAESAAASAASGALVLGPQDVATVQLAGSQSTITLSGPLAPKSVVVMRAQVGGTVANLRVDRGTPVRSGQTLATIRAAGVQSQAAGARAGVAAAEANLAVAQQRLTAATTLHNAGGISDIEFRTAQANFEAAQAQVAAARAQSASANETAGFTVISAPITGVVSDRRVQEGEAVKPGDELLTVVNGSTLELSGQIGVADAARVRVGQPVTFTLDAYPNEVFRGRVARIDPVADAGTRQVGVYVELPNPAGRLIGGQYARGSIATGGNGSAPRLVIPASAVREADGGGTGAFVLAVQNGRVVKRPVTLGSRDDASGTVAVVSGLQAGEQVITVPAAELKVGTAVTIAVAASNSDAAGARLAPASGTVKE